MPPYAQTHIIHPAEKIPGRRELLRWAGWFFLANSFIALLGGAAEEIFTFSAFLWAMLGLSRCLIIQHAHALGDG